MASAFKCDVCGSYQDNVIVNVRFIDLSYSSLSDKAIIEFDMCKTCHGKVLDLFASIGASRNFENQFVKFL